jgi:hypothetical protein
VATEAVTDVNDSESSSRATEIRSRMSKLLTVTVGIGVLAALVPAVPAAAAANAAPPPRYEPGMAYNAIHGQAVLFGGSGNSGYDHGDTWTWDGTDWTKRTPAHRPPARYGMGMTYDASRRNVVLFGGDVIGGSRFGDTWTWDGADWTKHSSAHSPPARVGMGMTYDAARGQVVLFGGEGSSLLGDTWTWDGTDWTQHTPAHSPPARWVMGMAYDTTRRQVVLFGGYGGGLRGDTWTWNGADWTKRSPAHSPSPRADLAMAGDSARDEVVLFGGFDDSNNPLRGDTWRWDGTDWTKLTPAHSPLARYGMGIAYDAARTQVMMFGGSARPDFAGDTWTWDGTDWTLHLAGSISLSPRSGSPGSSVRVRGWGFAGGETVKLTFFDSAQGKIFLGRTRTDRSGGFTTQVTIPANATPGTQHVRARGLTSGEVARQRFTVT